jgi:hypothetical protein
MKYLVESSWFVLLCRYGVRKEGKLSRGTLCVFEVPKLPCPGLYSAERKAS